MVEIPLAERPVLGVLKDSGRRNSVRKVKIEKGKLVWTPALTESKEGGSGKGQESATGMGRETTSKPARFANGVKSAAPEKSLWRTSDGRVCHPPLFSRLFP